MDHTTCSGVAVVVTVAPPAEALAVIGDHDPPLSQSQVVTPTSWSRLAGGLSPMSGAPSGVRLRACWARAAGSTATAGGWASQMTIPVLRPWASTQTCWYH